jgi:hypothetical protein
MTDSQSRTAPRDLPDWSHLQDVYGPAVEVPALIEQALQGTVQDARKWEALYLRLVHQGFVTEVLPNAVSWILGRMPELCKPVPLKAVRFYASPP